MDRDDYTSGAKSLHWLIALLIFVLFPLGWVMGDFSGAQKAQAFNLHKSLGIIVLTLMALRIVWRGLYSAPALPTTMPPLERTAAKLGHFALYALLFALPLTGWALISTSGKPSLLFGYTDIPLSPGLATCPPTRRKATMKPLKARMACLPMCCFSSSRRISRQRSATPSCSRMESFPECCPALAGKPSLPRCS